MAVRILEQPARYTLPDKSKPNGRVWLTSRSLGWSSESSEAESLEISFAAIQGTLQRSKAKPLLRVSTAAAAHVFDFDSEADREYVVAKATELLQEQRSGGSAQRSRNRGLTGPNVAAKKRALDQDGSLLELWTGLVQEGTLSDEEFWASRQRLLRGPQGAKPQQQGFTSNLVHTIQPSVDGKSQQVTLSITPQVQQQLFKEEPHVHAAYQASVPGKMDAATFWRKYVDFLQRRTSLQKQGRSSVGFEESDSMFLPPPLRQKQLKDTVGADPTVNLAADFYDGFREGYGNLHDARKEAGAAVSMAGEAADIMATINRHGNVVLEGNAREEALAAWPRRTDAALDDLRSDTDAAFSALELQDPSRLFSAPAAVPASPSNLISLAAVRADVQAMLARPPQPARPDQAAVSAVVRELAQAGVSTLQAQEAAQAGQSLSRQQSRLRQQVMVVNELLRHFWASVPCSTPAREQKAKRMTDECTARQAAISSILDHAGHDADTMSATAHAALQSIQAAHERFAIEQARRAASHHASLMSQ